MASGWGTWAASACANQDWNRSRGCVTGSARILPDDGPEHRQKSGLESMFDRHRGRAGSMIMTMRHLLILLLAAGCTSPLAVEGAPCPCPADYLCDFATHRCVARRAAPAPDA